MKRLIVILIPLFFVALLAGCSLIDDDLSVCDKELVIDYDLQLHTALSVQLQAELAAQTEAPVRRALEQWLAPVFTDKAQDIDLRFYSEEKDDMRYRISEVINDNRTSYSIRLPQENYMHLAVANIDDNREVHMQDGDHSTTMQLRLSDKQEVSSLNTGVFTARLPMEVNDSTLHFDVHLYMITAAVAVVIDTTDCDSLVSLSGTMEGSASGFSVRDSSFLFTSAPTMLLENVPIEPSSAATLRRAAAEETAQYACMATVGLATQDDASWQVQINATLIGNRHTTTTITVEQPLQAGTLRVLKMKMGNNGGLNPEEGQKEVGVTVALDWKQGGGFDVDI
ncbi:MAG: hypothetical protein IJT35_07785 [Paludibacteraceae bacterium]|nr:hypothetical protein [Paludibacteraceae bacterium]